MSTFHVAYIALIDLASSALILAYLGRIKRCVGSEVILVGVFMASFGLFAQAIKNTVILFDLDYEVSNVLFWQFKDIGVFVAMSGVALKYGWRGIGSVED